MLVYNFIMVAFTSYNLDIYHKDSVGYAGVTVTMLFLVTAIGLRAYQLVGHYKQLKLVKAGAGAARRNVTQSQFMNENELYNSEVQSEQADEPKGVREGGQSSNKVTAKPRPHAQARTVRENKVKGLEMSNLEANFDDDEELKF